MAKKRRSPPDDPGDVPPAKSPVLHGDPSHDNVDDDDDNDSASGPSGAQEANLNDNRQNVPHPDIVDNYNITIHRDQEHVLGSRHIDFVLRINSSFIVTGYSSILDMLERIFENILTELLRDGRPDDRLRFVMRSSQLNRPISIPVLPVSDFSLDIIMTAIAAVLNSFEDFKLDSGVLINFVHIKMPEKGGWNVSGGLTTRREIDLFKFMKRKRCIIDTNRSNNTYCCERGILMMKWLHEHPDKSRGDTSFKKYKQGREITEDAKELRSAIGVGSSELIGVAELESLQKLPALEGKYQINVYSMRFMGGRIFRGGEAEKQINLLLYEKHYYLITSMATLFNVDEFCDKCGKVKTKDARKSHNCKASLCCFCQQTGCKNRSTKITYSFCPSCNRTFKTLECHCAHEESDCKKKVKCRNCHRLVLRSKIDPDTNEHEHCSEIYCIPCGKFVQPPHKFCSHKNARKRWMECERGVNNSAGN